METWFAAAQLTEAFAHQQQSQYLAEHIQVSARLIGDYMEAIAVGRTLNLSRWHLIVWLVSWAIAAAIADRGCATYNSLAGTAKTPKHVAAIVVGVVIGPEIGPFANSGAFGAVPSAVTIYTVLFSCLFASLAPFIFIKQRVSNSVHFLAWGGYLAACVAWFGSAILSLGHFLS